MFRCATCDKLSNECNWGNGPYAGTLLLYLQEIAVNKYKSWIILNILMLWTNLGFLHNQNGICYHLEFLIREWQTCLNMFVKLLCFTACELVLNIQETLKQLFTGTMQKGSANGPFLWTNTETSACQTWC